MKQINKISLLALFVFAFFGCRDSVNTSTQFTEEWLIPQSEVFDGGPGRDGIPAISNPAFVDNASISFMKENDLIIGVEFNGETRGYPHPILDWHEIINDKIGENYFSLTYCPLTGSAINYNRELNGEVTTFGVSGLLYNSNLIPYDRATNSNWSQMKTRCVNGKLIGQTTGIFNSFETSWKTWKKIFPEAKVVSTNTGYNRSYGTYPYGDYKTSDDLIFPVSHSDNALPKKERVHGIISADGAVAFRFNSFGDSVSLKTVEIDGKNVIVVGSEKDNFIVSFYSETASGKELSFTVVNDNLPVILRDNEGNLWNVFGRAVEGERTGERLKRTKSFIAYWFAWAAFYPEIELIE